MKEIDVNDAAEYADLEPEQVAKVLAYLIDDGWLFTSHIKQNPFDILA